MGDSAGHPGGTEEFAGRQHRGAPAEHASRHRPGGGGPTSGGRGWAAYKKNVTRGKRGFGNNPDEFKVAELDVSYLIKMLDDAPLWSYCEHFINEITEGKRGFCCGGDQCPPCDMGDIPNAYTVFDIALWVPDDSSADGGSWVRKYWRASPDPAGKVEAVAEMLANSRNRKVLSDEYLMVSKTESKKRQKGSTFNEFSVVLVKERDLEEDHGAYPLEDEDYTEFDKNPFDPEKLFPADSLRDLRTAAEALDD